MATDEAPLPLTISEWKSSQLAGGGLERLYYLIEQQRSTNEITKAWIAIATKEQIEVQWEKLQNCSDASSLPLYGVPFAAKDNIDVESFISTAACPSFSSIAATQDAHVIQNLKAAGAILVGKTNLDQFATGLVGTRSPYGAVPNSFDPSYVSGGSSSGSAVVVARGAVPFSLGTDTAGSGRVPAGFNNIVGIKPTRGALSARGVVPACRTLDCVSIFALTVEDAEHVLSAAEGYDVQDSYSRSRPEAIPASRPRGLGNRKLGSNPLLATPSSPNWFGRDDHYPAYERALEKARQLGWQCEVIDFSPLLQLAQLLYAGPWVAERYEAIRPFIESNSDAMDPVVREIIQSASKYSAADTFAGEYFRQDLTRQIETAFSKFDALLVPTTPTFPTLAQLVDRPVEENSNLGTYTNFVNFLDWSAISIPAGFRDDGLPFGITLIANSWDEPRLLELAQRWMSGEGRSLGATGIAGKDMTFSRVLKPPHDMVPVAVVGAHLRDFPLNKDLTSRGATFSSATFTSNQYKLFALHSSSGPKKPGLQRVYNGHVGAAIEVEVWDLPTSSLASFMTTIPSPLSIGSIELKDGSWVQGFVCEPWGLQDAADITSFGGWRAYTASLQSPMAKQDISRVLIANRGEIAVRIIRTLHKIGIVAITVHSDIDRQALHVRDADISLHLEGCSVSETYLNGPQLIQLAKSASADAVIPGYGFLSENADFATAVEEAGLTWIGPTPQQMSDLGLKHKAREIAIAANVPVVPGSQGLLQSVEEALVEAGRVGYPLMLKSTAGGGGIGLSHCKDEKALRDAFASVQRQAQNNFGNSGVFLERFVERARHVEVQILGRGNGEVFAAGERDCSLQRRHQKVIEESPAFMVPEEVRRRMAAAAIRIASSVHYRNVGTVEFVYDIDTQDFYFLEINTRLQVEHPVTEAVTGLDLVECMVAIANQRWDSLFSIKQGFNPQGTSIEVRLYSESPLQQFQPCSGRVTKLSFPDSLRVDTWISEGMEVTTSYDPMVAKLIAYGSDRKDAIQKLTQALKATVVEGVQTNLDYLRQIVASDLFESGKYTTKSLDTFQQVASSFEVVNPGPLTTVQAYPGRVGYWSVGVPPSGPMDDYSFRVANSLLGNAEDAAGLECTHQGPNLRFHCSTAIAVTGGEAELSLDGNLVPMNQVFMVDAGQRLCVGLVQKGYRVYVAVRGGIDVPQVMGSKTTFELGRLGGFRGRKLQARDILCIGPAISNDKVEMRSFQPLPLPSSPNAEWRVRVVPGPHTAPDYFTSSGFSTLFSSSWKIHHNSNRLGVRLTGPHPEWARATGGKAGLHPSNIHDSPYSIGSVSFTGDEAVILTQDGPSLGGFAAFCVIASADMWKIGQARPGDVVRFDPISLDEAVALQTRVAQETQSLKMSPGPALLELSLQERLADNQAILGHLGQEGQRVFARQAGDRAILLEFGSDFTIRQSFSIFAFCEQHRQTPIEDVEDLTPGVFTLHVSYQRGVSAKIMLDRVSKHFNTYTTPTRVPSRSLSLPLAFNDEVCRKAIERYSATIRSDAPWLPSNIKFLQQLNRVDDISNLLTSATSLVLGLGDVFMGSPCAIPLDPRHRLFGTKYNPSRSFTPRGAVGIGGQYMCIYATDSPGGYQLVGRTRNIWDSSLETAEAHKALEGETPWLFRLFDRITFYRVEECELNDSPIHIEEGFLDLDDYETWIKDNEADIDARAAEQAQAIAEYPLREDLLKPYEQTETASTVASTSGYGGIPGEVVKAAMPGRCYRVNVKEGDNVEKGTVLLCIESSKMEVEIRSPVDGKCIAVQVKPGDLFDANDDLMILEIQ